jgi:hypothetical protein
MLPDPNKIGAKVRRQLIVIESIYVAESYF